jgi:hypothetical protein
VSSGSTHRLATRQEAWNQLTDALRGFAGGSGWTFVVFLVLGIAGAALIARRSWSFVIWGVAALVLPPLLSTLVHTGRAPDLSPRHLIFVLPFWAAFVGVAVARLPLRVVAVAAVTVLAAISPQGIHDPRSITYTAALGSRDALAEPAAWLRENIRANDVLYPYSSVFLAALPESGRARALPRGQAQSLLAALDRIDYPAGNLYVAIPSGTASRDAPDFVAGREDFGSWTILRVEGPFRDEDAVLRETLVALAEARSSVVRPPPALQGWFDLNMDVICKSLLERSVRCVTQ